MLIILIYSSSLITHSAFLQCEKPLEEAMRFLQPLEDFSGSFLQTHYLGFEVYYRRSMLHEGNSKRIHLISLEKYLLMLRCLKRMKKIDSNNAKLHSCLMKFLQLGKAKKTLYLHLITSLF
jgi:hypothetical protein